MLGYSASFTAFALLQDQYDYFVLDSVLFPVANSNNNTHIVTVPFSLFPPPPPFPHPDAAAPPPSDHSIVLFYGGPLYHLSREVLHTWSAILHANKDAKLRLFAFPPDAVQVVTTKFRWFGHSDNVIEIVATPPSDTASSPSSPAATSSVASDVAVCLEARKVDNPQFVIDCLSQNVPVLSWNGFP